MRPSWEITGPAKEGLLENTLRGISGGSAARATGGWSAHSETRPSVAKNPCREAKRFSNQRTIGASGFGEERRRGQTDALEVAPSGAAPYGAAGRSRQFIGRGAHDHAGLPVGRAAGHGGPVPREPVSRRAGAGRFTGRRRFRGAARDGRGRRRLGATGERGAGGFHQ